LVLRGICYLAFYVLLLLSYSTGMKITPDYRLGD